VYLLIFSMETTITSGRYY